jgi:ribosomal-protein-alanine N-acetyltransferase
MATSDIILETPRLVLRKVIINDAPFFYELNSNPLVVQYTGDIAFKDLGTAENIVRFLQKQYEENSYARLIVIEKSTQTAIGWCGLKYHPDTKETDIGYRFMQQHWGKGYATESALACINYGFETLNLTRIIADAMKENIASINVLQKLGMTYFGETLIDNIESVIYEIKN